MLTLRRLEVRCREQVPESCGLSPGSDLGVLHFAVRNHGDSPYGGRVSLMSLLGPPTIVGASPELWEQIHPEPGACGVIADARYPIEIGFDPSLAAGRVRRFHTLFEIPRGRSVARVLYHDDDFPTCLSAPPTTYSGAACRSPRVRRADAIPCNFFER